MAVGRVWISNLKNKVDVIFKQLKADKKLNRNNFIEAFKEAYPDDYKALQFEFECKQIQFRRNRKGQPKQQPLSPDKILSNMYDNYYSKLVVLPAIKRNRQRTLDQIRCLLGKYGYKVKLVEPNVYDVVDKTNQEVVYGQFDFKDLKALRNELIQLSREKGGKIEKRKP